ncbi:endonuclease Q family protein [Gorillibacterium timonense]|uniref:endonuclease Q family protein n=1 Tax=Gorillibacterium timonense TaxID=1689269 RepID=UPI00071D863B|nr:endonuclease Q family protein [Gorillibacterium timonense]
MKDYFADLHIHIGRTERGIPVKITGARNLTFQNIAREASERKGMDIVGIIDCASPAVQEDIRACLQRGEMEEVRRGGLRYRNTVLLLGCEIEVHDPGFGPAHVLCYLPGLKEMEDFTEWLKPRMTNVTLSTQRLRATARELQETVLSRQGIIIPAHIFTPHKGLYGSATDRMIDLLDLSGVIAVELGLSADTAMAERFSELDAFPFVTNSDAHSLGKIGREYNRMKLAEPSFAELVKALRSRDGRAITANYGLNPRLGKYHRTYCEACSRIVDEPRQAADQCLYCGSRRIVRGVMDRIEEIADRATSLHAASRPPYIHQVPLEFIPGLGPKLLEKLLARFGTEMSILHRAAAGELAEVAGTRIADAIVASREGRLAVDAGGGGRYGRVSVT